MKIGVVGVGNMGERHGRAYASLVGADRVCLFDPDAGVLDAAARRLGAQACGSLQGLLDQVDAVSLCAPTASHAEEAAEILAAGVHLLIEKPICGSSQQARRLCAAIAPGQVVGVAHVERFNPVVRELVLRLDRPTRIEIQRHHPPSARSFDTTVVEDLMIHDIDLACHLLGDAFDPFAARIESSGDADSCQSELRTERVTVRLSADRAAAIRIRRIRIEDGQTVLVGDLLAQWLETQGPGGTGCESAGPVRVAAGGGDPLREELSTFLHCIRSGTPFPVTPADGIRALEVCERVRATCQPRAIRT